MGLHFRRRIRLLPGVSITPLRSGASTTVGVRGLHETIGQGKVTTSVGLPGTGINFKTTKTVNSSSVAGNRSAASSLGRVAGWLLIGVMVVAIVALLTT